MLRLAFILLLLCCNSALAVDLGNGVDYIPISRKLGVGTKTPSEQLTVNGSFAIKESSAPSNTSNFGKIYTNSSNSKLYFIDDGGTSYNLTNGATTYTPGGSNTWFQFNDSSSFGGNGALAFTKASKTLTVPADAPLDINSTTVSIADTNISFDGSSTTFTQTTGAITLTAANGSNTNVNLLGISDFIIDTNKLIVNNNGNVGIGYTTPNQLLSVNGAVSIKESSAPSASSTFGKLYANSSNSKLYFIDDGGTSYNLTNGSSLGATTAIDDLSDAKTSSASVFLGTNAGAADSGSTYSTSVGINSLKNNTSTGTYNSALGHQSLNGNTTGDDNVAVGSRSLNANSTGSNNTAIGSQSLQTNTTHNNTAIGKQSLYTNTTGQANTAGGLYSLMFNLTGHYNTAFGAQSEMYNEGGNGNTATGYNSLYNNTNGSFNTALGYQAGYGSSGSNISYANGVYLGYSAGMGLTIGGSNNVLIGYQAGDSVSTGTNNTFIGYKAGQNLNLGSSNIVIGDNNDAPSTVGNNQIDIADTIYGSSSTYNVGIGINNTSSKLTINGDFALREGSAATAGGSYGKLYVASADSELYFDADDQTALRITNNGSLATSIGGSNTWFQYNDSGSIAGNGAIAFTKASKTLTIPSDAPLDINSTTVSIADTNISFDGASTTFTGTGAMTITPGAGTDLSISLSTTGDFVVNTSQLFVDTSATNVGIGTTGPGKALEINSSGGNNLRLTYNDSDGSATNYSDFTMSSGGDLTIVASGGDISLSDENITSTGAWDLGSATSFEIPNSAAPTVNAAGEIALDTTITNHQPMMKYYSGSEEMTIISLPTTNLASTDGQSVTYNATNDEFEMTTITSGATDIDGLSDGKTSSVSVFLGTNAGSADSGSSYSVGLGINALKSNTSGGQYNAAVGYKTMNGNTTGDYNSALGAYALDVNTTGIENVSVGYRSLSSNTIGNGNTAVGVDTLYSNTSGAFNTAVGFGALNSNLTTGSNTAVGHQALYQNSSGTYNTAIGKSALYGGTSGDYNIAVGYDALRNSTGDNNIALGVKSGNSSLAASNGTYLGYWSGYAVTSGDNNLLLGYQSGDSIDTGSNNITIGYYAGQNISSGSDNIIIGTSNDATSATASDQLDIGDTIYADMSTDQVSIGTTTNYGTLTLEGTLALDEVAAPSNTTSGYGRIYVNSSNSKLYFRDDGGTNYNLINGDSFSSASYLRADASDSYTSGTLTFDSGTSVDINSTTVSIADTNISFDGASTTFTGTGAMTITPGAGTNLNVSLSTTGDFAVNTNQLYVDTSATNVGIGTSSPSVKLDIESSASADGIDINNTAADGDPRLAFQLSGTSTFTMGIDDGDSDKFKIGTSAIDTNTRLTIDSSGNIGIGYTTPNQLLSVNGAVSIKESSAPTNTSTFGKIYANSSNSKLYYIDDSNTAYNLTNGAAFSSTSYLRADASDSYTSGTLTFDSGTSVDINSTTVSIADTNISFDGASTTFTGTGAMTITPGAGTNLNVSLSTTGDFAVNTNHLYVDTSATNVGIGMSSPNEKLTVEGAISLDETSAPSNITGYGKVYVDSGNKELYFRASDQSTLKITNNGALANSSEALTINNLKDAVSDAYSVFLGNGAGLNHSGNTYNTALGINTLRSNTIGNGNVAIGYNSLYTNTTGTNSTALGYRTAYKNRLGYNNTAIGSLALTNISNGWNNTAIGMQALTGAKNNSNGNVAIGSAALLNNSNGSQNTALGHGSLYVNTQGNRNTSLGYGTLYANTTGNKNLAIGSDAGYNITTGSYNIMIGNGTTTTAATASYQMNIGDSLYADLSTDQVSIATTNNYGTLTVQGSLALGETSAPSNNSGYGKVYVDSSTKELYFHASDQSDDIPITGDGYISAAKNIFVQTASLPITSASETSLFYTGVGTTTLPANTLTSGRMLEIKAQGIYINNSGSSKNVTFKLKIGGSTIGNTIIVSLPDISTNYYHWSAIWTVTCRSAGSSGSVWSEGIVKYYDGSNTYEKATSNISASTVNTTVSRIIDFTVTSNTTEIDSYQTSIRLLQ